MIVNHADETEAELAQKEVQELLREDIDEEFRKLHIKEK